MQIVLKYGEGPQAIFDDLRRRIISGEIVPGSAVKIQRLAGDYGVSTVMMREVVRMLAADDLVELRPRRSPVVKLPDLSDIIEINEIRKALEPMALQRAIPNHTADSLGRCRDLVDRESREPDLWRKVELNRAFHLALLAPCGMKRVLDAIEEQYEGITRLAQYLVVGQEPTDDAPHGEHLAICDAVADGDVERAQAILRTHIQASSDRVERLLDAQVDGASTPGRAADASSGRTG